MTNPIGLHIQAQDGRVDRTKLYTHVNTAQYTTTTVLDNFDVAAQIAHDLPECIVLLRYFKEEEWNPDKETAVEHFHRRRSEWQAIIDAGLQDHVFLTIDCESQMTQVRCDGYADMIEEAVKVGVGLAVGGNSSGSVLSGWGEPNGWYAIGRRLLITLAKYKHLKRYFLRHHHYTTYYMWAVSNGLAPSHENARWEKRPAKIDWSLPQWHIGRDCYGVMKTCDALGIAYPWTIIDEAGLDDMSDIQGRIPVKLDGSDKAGGWHTLETQLHEWYGIEPGEAYANMLIWAWETVYKPLGFVIGMHVFTYGDASPVEIRRFEKFRVDNAPAYLRRMETYSQAEAPAPAPEPEPIPVPGPVPPKPSEENPNTGPTPSFHRIDGWILLLGFVLGLLAAVFLVELTRARAQEVNVVISIDQAAQVLLSAIAAIVLGIGVGGVQIPAVTPVANILKWVLNKTGISVSANTIVFAVAGIFTVLIWVSRPFGFETQVNTLLGWINIVASALSSVLTVAIGDQILHRQAQRAQVAVFGAQRVDPKPIEREPQAYQER